MSGFLNFVSEQRLDLPQPATRDACSGKTYIVTGSNVGLGFEAAQTLVRVGAQKVILAVRNVEAGKAAKAQIDRVTNTHNVTEVWSLDLDSDQSIKNFVKKATENLDRIDALIANAAVALGRWTMNKGHETCIQINVLSTLLLTVLMVPKLKECGRKFNFQPRICIVSSSVAFLPASKVELDKIKDDPGRKWNNEQLAVPESLYPRSKIILSLAVRELANLVPVSRTGVIINYTNPGFCKTSLSRNGTAVQRAQFGVMKALLGRTAEKGSRTLLHGAIAGSDSHGCYLSICNIMESQVPNWVTNNDGQRTQKNVWDAVAAELDGAAHGCLKAIL